MYPSHRKAHTHHYISHSGANCSSSKGQPTPTEHNTDRRKLIWKWFCCLPVHRTINPARTKPTSFSFGVYKHANSAFNVKHDNPPRHFSVALARDSARAIRSAAEVHHPSHVPSTACVCVCVYRTLAFTHSPAQTQSIEGRIGATDEWYGDDDGHGGGDGNNTPSATEELRWLNTYFFPTINRRIIRRTSISMQFA